MNLKLFSTIICLLVFTSSVCDGKIRNHRSSRVKTSSEKTIPAQTSKIRLLKSTTRQAVGKMKNGVFGWIQMSQVQKSLILTKRNTNTNILTIIMELVVNIFLKKMSLDKILSIMNFFLVT